MSVARNSASVSERWMPRPENTTFSLCGLHELHDVLESLARSRKRSEQRFKQSSGVECVGLGRGGCSQHLGFRVQALGFRVIRHGRAPSKDHRVHSPRSAPPISYSCVKS